MDRKRNSYRLPLILSGIIVTEIIFWTLFSAFLWFAGYFSTQTGTQLGFKNENALWALWLVVPIILIFYGFIRWKKNKLQSVGNQKVRAAMLQPISSFAVFLKFFLFRNAIVFLIIAMAQPVYGTKKIAGTRESLELIVALDISSSMNVKDIDKDLSRLEIAKRSMIQLVNQLRGEKLGIVIFAGGAYAQLPLTMDYEAAKMYINEIETNMISDQGTNVAAALDVSAMMFSKEKTSKAVLLITDAEDHEGGIDPILSQYKVKEIQLSILGLGTTKGGLIPNDPEKPEFGYKLDDRGAPILSKLSPAFVEELATKSNGTSIISQQAFPDMRYLLEKLKKMKRSTVKTIDFEVKANKYQFPLSLAIINWFLFVCFPATKWVKLRLKVKL